jgi:hypothetical protein
MTVATGGAARPYEATACFITYIRAIDLEGFRTSCIEMAAREQHFCRVLHERAEVKLASTLFRALVPAAAGPKVSARFSESRCIWWFYVGFTNQRPFSLLVLLNLADEAVHEYSSS